MLAKNPQICRVHGNSLWAYSVFGCFGCARQPSCIFAGNWYLDYNCVWLFIDYFFWKDLKLSRSGCSLLQSGCVYHVMCYIGFSLRKKGFGLFRLVHLRNKWMDRFCPDSEALIRPPWSCTIRFAMASPSPAL